MTKKNSIKPVIISPPFGNWLEREYLTSVKGTYTWQRRKGMAWQALKTIRKTEQGWKNGMGLRNPGLENIDCRNSEHIWSVTEIDGEWGNWTAIRDKLPLYGNVEVNLSCTNVDQVYSPTEEWFRDAQKTFDFVSVKLGPMQYSLMKQLYEEKGVRVFHLCNTLPENGGCESGGRLRPYSLKMIEHARQEFGDTVTIIGGGGIYEPQHVDDFYAAGVDHFSLSTICFTPWKFTPVVERIYEVAGDPQKLTNEPDPQALD